MKKFLSILLASLMVLSLASCGEQAETPIVPAEVKPEIPKVVITGNDAKGSSGVVASSNEKASQAGLEILKKGGNAVDAAVSMAYALSAIEPEKSGLGGGGYMLVYKAEDKSVTVIDYIETAPKNSTPQMWLNIDGQVAENEFGPLSKYSGMAVAVPGMVSGLDFAFENFGSQNLTRKDILKSAIELAGENKDLSEAFDLIAENGKNGFYTGKIAEAIVSSAKKLDGIITLEDLTSYNPDVYRADTSTYNDFNIYSNSVSAIEVLNVLDNFDMKDLDVNSSEYVHLLSEAFKIAAADRMAELDVTDKDYCITLAEKITDMSGNYGSDDVFFDETNNGTAFVVIDKDKNMVACVNSIGSLGGSKIEVEGFGFVLNNSMDKFNKNEKNPNTVIPLRRVPTSITTAIVTDADNNPIDVIACAGAVRSYMTVSQILSRTLSGMSLADAVNTSRVSDGNGKVAFETYRSSNPLVDQYITELQAMGHFTVDAKDDNLYFGSVAAANIDSSGFISVIDHRLENGKALGY